MSDEHFNGMSDALEAIRDPGSHPVGAPGSVRRQLQEVGQDLERMKLMLGALKAWCSRNGHTYAERLAMRGLGELARECQSCGFTGHVCDESLMKTEEARSESRGYIPGCVAPSHPGYRSCPECGTR